MQPTKACIIIKKKESPMKECIDKDSMCNLQTAKVCSKIEENPATIFVYQQFKINSLEIIPTLCAVSNYTLLLISTKLSTNLPAIKMG